MKKIFAVLACCLLWVGCSEGADSEIQLKSAKKQVVYADETEKSDAIRFTAVADWYATITQTRSGGSEVDWIALSQYEGSAGEYALTLTIQPNETGEDRSVTIRIICGETTITIVVEQRGITREEDDSDDDSDGDEEENIRVAIAQIKVANAVDWESFPSGSSGTDYEIIDINFTYDNTNRVTKIVHNTTFRGQPCMWLEQTITYNANNIAIATRQQNLDTNSAIETGSGSATLDSEGRVATYRYGDYYTANLSYSPTTGRVSLLKDSWADVTPTWKGENIERLTVDETSATLTYGRDLNRWYGIDWVLLALYGGYDEHRIPLLVLDTNKGFHTRELPVGCNVDNDTILNWVYTYNNKGMVASVSLIDEGEEEPDIKLEFTYVELAS